jgi:DNA-binding CsgD family transcriptional regulator
MMSVQPLTPAEQRVLEQRAGGAAYGDIASATGMTINEVIVVLGRICMKLGAVTEHEAVRSFTGADLEDALRAEHERRFGAEQEAA